MVENDRRHYSRTGKLSQITFHFIERGAKKVHQAMVIDGSQGGIRFRVQESIPKNTRLYIRLDSEKWEEELSCFLQDDGYTVIEMIGSVMWCQEDGGEFEVGARFIGYTEQ